MQLHKLTPAQGSVKKRKRAVGRGQGSSRGGTATKGHKGAQSRSGYKARPGREGGQKPLHLRIPKFGFKNHARSIYKPINLDKLQMLADKLNTRTIDRNLLLANSLVDKKPYKVLAKGKESLKNPISVAAHAFSLSAKLAIEKVGGSIIILH